MVKRLARQTPSPAFASLLLKQKAVAEKWATSPVGRGSFSTTRFTYIVQTFRFEKKCREGVYSEIYRVLKPGSVFACYEWCLTDKYDASNEKHRLIKKQIEVRAAIQVTGVTTRGPATQAYTTRHVRLRQPTVV